MLRSRPLEERIVATQLFAREVMPWLASGAVVTRVDATFPLERIAEGSEVVVYYGDQSVSDVPREGFVACRCASCAGAGKYVMG